MRMINHPTFGRIAEFNEAEMNHGPDERACKSCHTIFNVREATGAAPVVGIRYACTTCEPRPKTGLQAIDAVCAKTKEALAASEAGDYEKFFPLWEERNNLYEEYLRISKSEELDYLVAMDRACYFPARTE